MTPNGSENEEELNENASKGQNTAHDNARQWFGVKDLIRYGPWDRIGANGMFNRPLLVAVEGAQEG